MAQRSKTIMQGSNEFRGRRVTVMGLGRFGGGVGAARFLADRGAHVTVTDLRSEIEVADAMRTLDGLPIERSVFGRHDERDFVEADLVVVNPAVRPGNVYVAAATAAGVPTTTEIALFVAEQRGRIVGVTGTNGKSTTASLIHDVLAADGCATRLGGNIGGSLLDEVDDVGPDDWTVLELSSFQLTHLDAVLYSPDVAVVTNFAANHLDWHPTLEHYEASKQAILRWQTPQHVAVLNAASVVSRWPTNGRRLTYGGREADATGDGVFVTETGCRSRAGSVTTDFPLRDWLRLPGAHVLSNAMAAIAVGTAFGTSRAAIETALRAFEPLPHRLQFVAEVAGRRFYDDSNATTPESVRAGLAAFTAPVVLLAGGYDKGIDLSPLCETIRDGAKAVALMGQTGPRLAEMLRDPAGGRHLPKKVSRSFEHAFEWAISKSAPGDVVLLSPGCASFDWFRDYEDRGERFRAAVREYARLIDGAAATRPPIDQRRTA
jgi:UDP-N-acetylmuramoylalanine--D-glutamate ligase